MNNLTDDLSRFFVGSSRVRIEPARWELPAVRAQRSEGAGTIGRPAAPRRHSRADAKRQRAYYSDLAAAGNWAALRRSKCAQFRSAESIFPSVKYRGRSFAARDRS